MKRKKPFFHIKYTYIASDFETTTTGRADQKDTAVWSVCSIDLDAADDPAAAVIHHSIEEFFNYIENRAKLENLCIYFHNLKFDGSFILDYLMRSKVYKQALTDSGEFAKDLPKSGGNYTYTYSISDRGQWYTISIKLHGHYIEFRDSAKLLPFTLEKIGKDFHTKHKKLKMKYTGDRYPGCEISKEETEYIKNDVLVLKEGLNFMFSEGHNKLTIGACCLSEFKSFYDKEDYKNFFPDLTQIKIDKKIYGAENADEYIRKSYHGGWCYVVPEKAGKEYNAKKPGDIVGTTADVNSLYPSMMHSDSGNYYPVGKPKFWRGAIPKEVQGGSFYYFIRFKCHFKIKNNMLPTVQIKNSPLFYGREWLKSSQIKDRTGEPCDVLVTLTMTCTDYELFLKHYDVYDLKILDGCYFYKEIGLFDSYINHYAEIKIKNAGTALATLSKLFLNNLYGKLAAGTNSSFKTAYIDPETNAIRFKDVPENEKQPGFIAIGSAITSYSRCFTITAAQANYHGPNKRGFIYADTDSIHCDLLPDEIKGAPEHPTAFNHWKYETCWDYGLFVRSKTYIEHVTHENREPAKKQYYNLKCAGMGERSKDIFIAACTGDSDIIKKIENDENTTDDEIAYIKAGKTFKDFKVGLCVPGSLRAKRITGGTLLMKSDYVMHETIFKISVQ